MASANDIKDDQEVAVDEQLTKLNEQMAKLKIDQDADLDLRPLN